MQAFLNDLMLKKRLLVTSRLYKNGKFLKDMNYTLSMLSVDKQSSFKQGNLIQGSFLANLLPSMKVK